MTDPAAITSTVQAITPPFWSILSSITWLHGLFGVGGALATWLLTNYKAVWGLLVSPTGQALISDVEAATPIVIKMLADSGHPMSTQGTQIINEALVMAQKVKS